MPLNQASKTHQISVGRVSNRKTRQQRAECSLSQGRSIEPYNIEPVRSVAGPVGVVLCPSGKRAVQAA